VQALKDCLFATEIKAHMKAIPIRSAKEEEKHWKARVKIRVEIKKLSRSFQLWQVSVPKPCKENGQRRSDLLKNTRTVFEDPFTGDI